MASILVIDDDEQIRKFSQSVLEREGHEVEVASNGKEGISGYRKNSKDLIILDILMSAKKIHFASHPFNRSII